MKLLLIREQGRAVAARGGGIYRSGVAIEGALTRLGWSVQAHRIFDPLPAMPEVDVALFYGPFTHLDNVATQALAHGTPLVFVTGFYPKKHRVRQLHRWWGQWGKSPLVFFGVWSYSAEYMPPLRDLAPQVVMLPKSLRSFAGDPPPWKERHGITFGDLKKAHRTSLCPGIDVERAIALIRERWPEEPLLFFEQHPTDGPVYEGTWVVPYQTDLLGWLSRRKLFVSFVTHETYAMVPTEAQAAGTPVVYRHMPQSLTETIGQTGLMYRDHQDLLDCMDLLLSDQARWEAYSRAGRLNSAAHQHFDVGLDVALRRIIKLAQRRRHS